MERKALFGGGTGLTGAHAVKDVSELLGRRQMAPSPALGDSFHLACTSLGAVRCTCGRLHAEVQSSLPFPLLAQLRAAALLSLAGGCKVRVSTARGGRMSIEAAATASRLKCLLSTVLHERLTTRYPLAAALWLLIDACSSTQHTALPQVARQVQRLVPQRPPGPAPRPRLQGGAAALLLLQPKGRLTQCPGGMMARQYALPHAMWHVLLSRLHLRSALEITPAGSQQECKRWVWP